MSNNNNSSIVEITSLEKEIQMLLAQYNDELMGANANKMGTMGANANAIGTNANEIGAMGKQMSALNLMQINQKLIGLISRVQNKTAEFYPQGIKNQQSVLMNNDNLIKVAKQLKEDEKTLQASIDEYNSLEGENGALKLQMKSSYYEYMFYILMCIILGIYVVKVYSIPNENLSIFSIENLLLIIAILLIMYHYSIYIYRIFQNTVVYTVTSIGNFYNFL